jgi:hypothetical protein
MHAKTFNPDYALENFRTHNEKEKSIIKSILSNHLNGVFLSRGL